MSDLLTTEAAAARLGVAPQTMTDWRWKSRGPKFVKVGRLVRYRLSDLEAWLDAQVTGGDSK